ncbi:MAG: STAS domain-containing protein [bacterium]
MVLFDLNAPEKQLSCKFTGRLDTSACLKISDEINMKLSEISEPGLETIRGYNIVFDLKGVNYIASSFIRICVNTAKKSEKGKFSIINSDPFIKKTFKIAGLDDTLKVS